MKRGYNIFRRLDDGQILHVAWRRSPEQARQLIADLSDTWPGEYGYREAEGVAISCMPDSLAREKFASS